MIAAVVGQRRRILAGREDVEELRAAPITFLSLPFRSIPSRKFCRASFWLRLHRRAFWLNCNASCSLAADTSHGIRDDFDLISVSLGSQVSTFDHELRSALSVFRPSNGNQSPSHS